MTVVSLCARPALRLVVDNSDMPPPDLLADMPDPQGGFGAADPGVDMEPALIWAARELGPRGLLVLEAGTIEGLVRMLDQLADEAALLGLTGEGVDGARFDTGALTLGARLQALAAMVAAMGCPLDDGPDGGGPGGGLPVQQQRRVA